MRFLEIDSKLHRYGFVQFFHKLLRKQALMSNESDAGGFVGEFGQVVENALLKTMMSSHGTLDHQCRRSFGLNENTLAQLGRRSDSKILCGFIRSFRSV